MNLNPNDLMNHTYSQDGVYLEVVAVTIDYPTQEYETWGGRGRQHVSGGPPTLALDIAYAGPSSLTHVHEMLVPLLGEDLDINQMRLSSMTPSRMTAVMLIPAQPDTPPQSHPLQQERMIEQFKQGATIVLQGDDDAE